MQHWVTKPGAAFYRSQGDPAAAPVILPAFGWGPGRAGPGPDAVIFTNCDQLEIYAGGRHLVTGTPDRRRFPHLAHAPVFADLTIGTGRSMLLLPELRIDGYLGGVKVATTVMSADPYRDQLSLTADEAEIAADGIDATRITVRAVDAYGHQRRGAGGEVSLTFDGPAELIADNPFPFGVYGPVGGAFVRSLAGQTGQVAIMAEHPTLGRATVQITTAQVKRTWLTRR